MWPGFDSQTGRHIWGEFVGSVLCSERFFPGYSGFSHSSKTYIKCNLICFELISIDSVPNWCLSARRLSAQIKFLPFYVFVKIILL